MRRIPFIAAFTIAAMVLGMMFLTDAAARAQEATPAASPAAVPTLLQAVLDGANAGDGAAVAALYTEDGIHEDIPAGVMARGREEIAAYIDGVVSQFGSLQLEPVSARQSGDLAVLEYTLSVTDPHSGAPITYQGVLVFELAGDQIRRSADYYDFASILRQLGLLEIPEEATPAP